MKAQQARSKDTVERILSAAASIFADGGLKAVTHRAVAERAGVSLSSTTRFFSSKQELLEQTYKWGLEHARIRYQEMDSRLETHKKASLDNYCRKVLGDDLTNHSLENLTLYHFVIESSREDSLRPVTEELRKEMLLFWESLGEKAGVSDNSKIQVLLDYLIGEYYMVLASNTNRLQEIRQAQQRAKMVAIATEKQQP